MNRLMITGTDSGCGKTTVTCALLSAFVARGLEVAAFKSGPDYIDPMFHREISGIRAYNLDPFFLDREGLRRHISRYAGQDVSVIEGAMGFYDGIASTTESSSYVTARDTETPVVLVINAKGSGNSVAAVMEGFKAHKSDSGIRGVIFNGIAASRYPDLERCTRDAGLTPLGYLPHNAENSVESRHLGLVTAGEISDIRQKLARLGELASQSLDIDGLLELAGKAPKLEPCQVAVRAGKRVKIALAEDKAFCFIYRENLELLQELGAEIVKFSPLDDSRFPEDIDALYLCGGYPELYAEQLSGQSAMLEDIRNAVSSGLPTIAECGGFMYLHDSLDGHGMARVIPGKVYKTERLQRFGYITLNSDSDNLLFPNGGALRSHEFHYWDSDNPGSDLTAKKAGRSAEYACAHLSETLYAGFPHIYFDENTARRFVDKAAGYRRSRGSL